MKTKPLHFCVAICLLLLAALPIIGTGQAGDKIIYEGKERTLFANPLEDYYEQGKKKRPNFMIGPNTISSGCWRGYIATWEIKDNALYLRGIESWVNGRRTTISTLFPRQDIKDGRVKASWFSGELRIPDGEQLLYVHMGYGSVYERDIILTLEKGIVTKKSTIDNTKRVLPSSMELQKEELEKMRQKIKP